MKRFEVVVHKRQYISIDELGRLVDLHPEVLHRFMMLGLIDPEVEKPQPLFEDTTVARIRKIQRLRGDLGINLAGCGLVLDLLERIDELEREISFLRGWR